ncbi:MAG: restriction endonuclease, partial [Acidobacteriota bacterium]
DLNSRPDQSPSRWVINFRDWPLDRSAEGSWERADEDRRTEWRRSGRVPKDYPGPVAADYPDCLEVVRTKVKPERDRNPRKQRRERWWQYAERAPELYATIAGLERVLVTAQTSNKWAPAFQATDIVYSHTVVVFPISEWWHYVIMQSALHEHWRLEYGASLKQDARYTPSDCYDTFPFPLPIPLEIGELGDRYHSARATLTRCREEGLTRLYTQFHDASSRKPDIGALRDLHVQLDLSAVRAYGWTDIELNHGFHQTKQGIRFTISPAARQEVLDRLLELNHQRYREEVEQGLHDEANGRRKTSGRKRGRAAATSSPLLEGV